jgi:two-component system, OmpR family, phosphate regulon sensor histidine kinase PhoR
LSLQMTRIRWISPSTTALAACILVAGLFFVAGDIIGHWLPGRTAWVALVLLLTLFGIGHTRFAAARACRTQGVIRALQQIAEGSNAWRRNWASQVTMSGLGEEMREAVEVLSERVDALRREKQRAELVLANMSDGIISVDCDGRITLFNRAASAFFRKKESQLVGRTLDEAQLHPEITRLAQECLSSESGASSEITMPGYAQRVLRVRAAPYRSSTAGPECAVIVLQDLTDVRRHERYQKEFATNVSHELKTPITAVRSTAETLLAGAKYDEEVVDRFLNSIISEIDRLSALTDDIMEIAKLDSGVMRVEKEISSVYDTVKRAVGVLTPQAEQGKLHLTTSVPDDLSGFFDADQIVHVVRNLADNAIKYTPEGGAIEVGARQEGPDLLIWVKDTGIGIPRGEIERVFNRFYRVDKARSRRIGGTGLGLAIVKDIVESHGGRIKVDTEMGRGSTFTVVLPGAADIPSE